MTLKRKIVSKNNETNVNVKKVKFEDGKSPSKSSNTSKIKKTVKKSKQLSGKNKKPFKKTTKGAKQLNSKIKKEESKSPDDETVKKEIITDEKEKVVLSKEEIKKEARLKQKQLKEKRQKTKRNATSKMDAELLKNQPTDETDVYTLSCRAKQIWERLRSSTIEEFDKVKLCNELYNLVAGHVKKIVFAHDTVRVIECLVANSNESNIKQKLFEELQNDVIEMSKSKYASFFVLKLISYGNKEQKNKLFDSFQSKVVDLMKHKVANNVVELFYNDVATAPQRHFMLQEFFGPQFRLLKEVDVKSAVQMVQKYPEKLKSIRKHLGDEVQTLIKKGCFNHSFIHTVILNYLQLLLTPFMEDEKNENNNVEKSLTELIESLREVCVHIVHSREGSKVTQLCLIHGTSKDRKAIIKSFKSYVTKICTEQFGHVAMITLFNVVDDTKIVGKAIINEMIENLGPIVENSYGRRVLMYLVGGGRCTKYFDPQFIATLKESDVNKTSKKDVNIRQTELKSYIDNALCETVIQNVSTLITSGNSNATIFLACLAAHVSKDLQSLLFKSICLEVTMATSQDKTSELEAESVTKLIESKSMNQLMKKLILECDKTTNQNDENSSKTSPSLFSSVLLTAMESECEVNSGQCSSTCLTWLRSNRGSFLFVYMLETEIEEVCERVKKLLNNVTKHKSALERQATKSKGAEILLKKIENF